jgi:hypothetical protein
MTIPESQLKIWSHQGSVTQSKDTYATIKRALEDANANYTNRNFEVFLQGSYGNDTNIFAESDVDVVIRYDGAFFYDLTELPADQQSAFKAFFPDDGTYPYSTFKGHVQAALEAAFGRSVKPGKKAIKVAASGSRRSADVVVAFEYRRYYKFNGVYDQSCDTGMAFFTSNNTRIANYPKQHSKNCTAKHQATGNKFKPLVRIFKNMRSKLVDDGIIGEGVAPSYFIEGLLYNVPDNNFSGTYEKMVFNILTWLQQTTDRTKFLCANEQYYLLRDNGPVCWPVTNGEQFINAAIRLWNDW